MPARKSCYCLFHYHNVSAESPFMPEPSEVEAVCRKVRKNATGATLFQRMTRQRLWITAPRRSGAGCGAARLHRLTERTSPAAKNILIEYRWRCSSIRGMTGKSVRDSRLASESRRRERLVWVSATTAACCSEDTCGLGSLDYPRRRRASSFNRSARQPERCCFKRSSAVEAFLRICGGFRASQRRFS